MRELKKKPDAQEMLVVHKPAQKPDPDKSGREHGDSARLPAMAEELELMRKRLSLAKDSRAKRQLLAEIQRRFGNEKAAQLVQGVRLDADGDGPPPARKAKP